MRYLLAPAAAVLLMGGVARDGVHVAMEDSAAGWNVGDLGRFMAIYADDATFVGRSGLVKGKVAIAARYRPSFAKGANLRGRLSFRYLDELSLGGGHRIVWAQWTLAGRKTESGMTTLVFEERDGRWKIISDHSS